MRKMKKFAAGGSDKYKAKYDRKVADIKSDYDKAMKGKTGKAADVAKAKYEQRMADAKDDLAKWTKSDRTETRAGEKAAERNLSMTRKFGAMKSAVKADDVAKVSSTDDILKSAPKPQMPSEPEAKPTRRPAPAPTRRPASTTVRQPEKPAATKPDAYDKIRGTLDKINADVTRRASLSEKENPLVKGDAPKIFFGKRNVGLGPAAVEARAAAERKRRAELTNQRRTESAAAKTKMASGGTVKKKSPTQKPPPPTAEEIRKRNEQNKSLGGIKSSDVSSGDRGAIGRGNRSSGMKKGGAVKKYAAGGLTKVMPTANEMGNLGMAKGGKVKGGSFRASANGIAKKGTTKAKMPKMAGGGKCYAKGGSVSSRADGIARKGKTNCKTR